MATYKCNVEQAKVYSKVGSGDIGSLKRGDLFFSDGREFSDPQGVLYLYGNYTSNGVSKTGYVKKAQLILVPSSPPPPDPDPDPVEEYVLHVKDGVTRKFIPE